MDEIAKDESNQLQKHKSNPYVVTISNIPKLLNTNEDKKGHTLSHGGDDKKYMTLRPQIAYQN